MTKNLASCGSEFDNARNEIMLEWHKVDKNEASIAKSTIPFTHSSSGRSARIFLITYCFSVVDAAKFERASEATSLISNSSLSSILSTEQTLENPPNPTFFPMIISFARKEGKINQLLHIKESKY